MQTKRYHIFNCPVCGAEHMGKINDFLDLRLRTFFPNTYGQGKLICGNCLPDKLLSLEDN